MGKKLVWPDVIEKKHDFDTDQLCIIRTVSLYIYNNCVYIILVRLKNF